MYTGFFINLKQNTTRHQYMLKQLETAGLSSFYQRFEALNGQQQKTAELPLTAGQIGLWLSHETLLQNCLNASEHVHILEDDTLLPPHAHTAFEEMLQFADQQFPDWELIFTDIFVPFSTREFYLLHQYMSQYFQTRQKTLLDLSPLHFACTNSIFFNQKALGKYLSIISGQWNQTLPLDLFLRKKVQQGELKAYVTLPFLTSLAPENLLSDIAGPLPRSRQVADLLRQGFYQEAHYPALLESMRNLTQGIQVDSLSSLFLNGLAFSLSDQWQRY